MSDAYTKLSSKGQVTLPKSAREAAHLKEGDPLKVEETPEGTIVLRPQKMVDAAKAWFFTSAWQDGERQASADIAAGRITRYESGEGSFRRSMNSSGSGCPPSTSRANSGAMKSA